MKPLAKLTALTIFAWSLGLSLVCGGRSALAHHSFAMFDYSRTVTLKGVIKELQWTNPHVIVWVETAPAAGAAPELWSAELTSPGNLTRRGWTKRTLKPGDKVEVDVSPLRDGSHGGGFRRAVLADTGQVFTSDLRAQGGPAGQ